MNNRDELIRTKLLDRLTSVNVDIRMVALEVNHGEVNVRGAVPSIEQRSRDQT
jgi:osmotically-inducible protein OsmY